MKKRLVYVLACIMALGVSAFAGADAGRAGAGPRTREDVAKLRESRPRKARSAQDSAPIMRVHAGDKQLYAFHRDAYELLNGWTGLVKVMAGASDPETVQHLPGDNIFQAAYMNDKALVVRTSFGDYVTYEMYDTETWTAKSTVRYPKTNSNKLPYGLTYDHTTDKVYGSFFASSGSFMEDTDAQFGYVNLDNAAEPVTIIGELPVRMRAMTIDAVGDLYGLSFDGDLYKINKFTGDAEATGVHVDLPTQDFGDPTAPFVTYGVESMCCDWESGDFFIAYGDDMFNTYVARFNPVTAEAELVADYSYSDYGALDCNVLTGLYFMQSGAVAKGTPAAVADVTVEAVGTEMKAKVAFVMPAVDTDGAAIDADMTWTVSNGNSELATGTAHSGAKVETTVNVNSTGRVMLAVTATLGGVTSNPASASAFIGCDVPKISGRPTVRVSGQRVTVSWNDAESVNGGNLDPVTYKVTRQPDNLVVAEANATTSFVDEITSDIKTRYYYEIQPKSGANEGEAVTSRQAFAGKYIALPLNEQFDDPDMFLEYPIIDANKDDNIWEHSTVDGGVALFPGNNAEADDYLLIGPFKMERGTTYTFHMSAGGHSKAETIEVKVGTNPNNVESFSTELVPPTILNPNTEGTKNFDVSFEPETSGDYYFGIHACTPGASKYVYVYEVAVKALSGSYPAAPEALDVEPQAHSAVVRFTLPSKSINGSSLKELKEARVYRDNTLIASITDGVAPGAAISYTDNDAVSKGYHNYSVTAVGSESEGKSASCQVWRGADFPGRPSKLRIWEDLETPGLMHATFDHPKRGYYGGYINQDEIVYLIDYLVMGVSSGVIELGHGTEHTFKLPFNVAAQDVFAGSVYGRNAEGYITGSSNWITSTAYFGPAFQLPLHDSWSGGARSGGTWSSQNIDDDAVLSQTYWGTVASNSQDMDGGIMAMTTTVDNGGKRELSPRVTLEGAETPALVFYYLYTAKATQFDLEILVEDQPARLLKSLDLNPANAGKWIRVEVPLTDYISAKYIQFGFTARGMAGENIACIDNLTISDLKSNNLSVIGFNAPVKTDANTEARLGVRVRNTGTVAVNASDYTVKFYKNDEVFAEVPGVALKIDSESYIYASDRPTVADGAEVTYYAEVDYAADMNPADNASSRAGVRVVIADYPTVSDLKATFDDGITLTWSDPDMSKIPGVSTTESFESYDTFIIENIGEWSLYDGDKCNTARLATSLGVLDYPHIGEPMAWQVFEPAEANVFSTAWEARSGKKFLVSFQAASSATRDIRSDDWLISPELNAAEQVISFYSRAGMSSYAPEVFDFMVSDKTTAIADFKPLATEVEVPYTSESWTEYTFRVPAGTRYFAIVHKSANKLAMLVDDISYVPAGSAPVQLDLEGFNVYRDGKRITAEPIGENIYVDRDVETGTEYTYNVSAVWNRGESRLSDSVTISASSIDGVTAYELHISGHKGFIRISGGIGEQAEVYNMAGVRVAMVKAEDTVEIPVAAAGVYVVRAGGVYAKVIVR